MRHRKNVPTLDRRKGPREALLKNLATNVILHEKIETTRAKARYIRPIVERLITRGKVNTLVSRRYLTARLNTEGAVLKVLEVLGPRYLERKGGYLRLTKMGFRQGDAAEMVCVEFV